MAVKKNKAQANTVPPDNQLAPQKGRVNFLANYILALVVVFTLFLIYINVPSYQWVKKELIDENLKIINKNKRLKYDDKLERLKFGFDYSIVKIIKSTTPENSIILMPMDVIKLDSVRKANKASLPNNLGGITNPNWVNYYLYPARKVVFDSTIAGITHIAVIGCLNLDLLKYQPEKIDCFTVYPVQK